MLGVNRSSLFFRQKERFDVDGPWAIGVVKRLIGKLANLPQPKKQNSPM
jgi:hypothetical protein